MEEDNINNKGAVCPIIKTCQALYQGGFVPDNDSDSCKCTIDSREYIFDEAPVKVAIGAFADVRDQMYEKTGSRDQDDIKDYKVLDHLHDLEVRESIRDLMKTGSAEILTKDDILDRYALGKNNKERELSMVSRIKQITRNQDQ